MPSDKIPGFASVGFALVAVPLVVAAIIWPSWAGEVFHSRLFAALAGVWCGGVALLLRPAVTTGLAQGLQEFRKATREIRDDINKWL